MVDKVFITRHGQSQTNADKELTLDHDDNGLTELGTKQARSFGLQLALKKRHVTATITSPLKRAVQSHNLIIEELGVRVASQSLEPNLREIDWKNVDGDDPLESTRGAPIDHKPLIIPSRRLRSTESQLDLYERVIPAFIRAVGAHRHLGGDLLVVTHFFPVKAICSFAEHGGPERMDNYWPDNLCEVVYELDHVREAIKRAEKKGLYVA
jgi:broad specificity phosphatase PhoE